MVQDKETGRLEGIEAVIDKDRAATMVGEALGAHGLIILTDVTGVAVDFQKAGQRWIRAASPGALERLMGEFPDGVVCVIRINQGRKCFCKTS